MWSLRRVVDAGVLHGVVMARIPPAYIRTMTVPGSGTQRTGPRQGAAPPSSVCKLDAANQILPTVRDTLAENPILADKVRFSVIDFSDDGQVGMPLCEPLDEAVYLPTMKVRGRTSYASTFWLLRSEIESDIKQLKADGFAVFRPAVFFLTDGLPTDEAAVWRDAFADLTQWDKQTQQGFRTYPNVIPCGVGQADPATLRELIHPAEGSKRMQMYLMEKGGDAAQATAPSPRSWCRASSPPGRA